VQYERVAGVLVLCIGFACPADSSSHQIGCPLEWCTIGLRFMGLLTRFASVTWPEVLAFGRLLCIL
jgi:hypothetical protein